MKVLELDAPASKSETQRALVLAALADAPTRIERPLDCDDSRHLRGVLAALGATVASDGPRALLVTPAALPLRGSGDALPCGNAGTVVRFCAPLALLCDGALHLDGDEHMRRRPVGPLGRALTSLGVDVRFLGRDGCPPILLRREGPTPRRVAVDTTLSSQFASGLLLVAPLLERGLELELTGDLVSRPYLEMTRVMLERRGCDICWLDERNLVVTPSRPGGGTITVEADWSSAAFLLVAGRLAGVEVKPLGLESPGSSLQGDAAIVRLLATLDRAEPCTLDLTDVPDLIAPLTAAALFAHAPTRLRGAAHTRVKECDRVAVLARELGKLGAFVRERDDGLDIEPLRSLPRGTFELDPASDHRMAMAFGLVSLRIPGIAVRDRSCVSKSFPTFWEALTTIRSVAATPA